MEKSKQKPTRTLQKIICSASFAVLLALVGLFIHLSTTANAQLAAVYDVHAGAPTIAIPLPTQITGKPVHIQVPSLSIDLPLTDGAYSAADHSWTLSFSSAQYAVASSPLSTSSGNTFIYGHNTWQIFGRLSSLQPGQEIIIEADSGIKFYYSLDSSTDIQPDNVEFLNYTGSPIVTIQTCSGNWNEKRRMFRFNLERAEIPKATQA